jgi:hypothetical protein
MIFVLMSLKRNWKLLDRYPFCFDIWKSDGCLFLMKSCLPSKMCGSISLFWSLCLQFLRNEEGKKLGLKVNEKSSVPKENDVKMTDAEVRNQPNLTSRCYGSDSIPWLKGLLAWIVGIWWSWNDMYSSFPKYNFLCFKNDNYQCY